MSAADKMFTTCGAACDMLVVRRPATMMSAPGIETSTSPDCAAASSAVVGVEVVPASPAAVAGSVWAIAVGATSAVEIRSRRAKVSGFDMKIPLKNLVQSWLGSAPLHASPRHFGLWSGCRDGGARPACRTEVRRDGVAGPAGIPGVVGILHRRSEEHTSELQSLRRISYAVFCLQKKKNNYTINLSTTLISYVDNDIHETTAACQLIYHNHRNKKTVETPKPVKSSPTIIQQMKLHRILTQRRHHPPSINHY